MLWFQALCCKSSDIPRYVCEAWESKGLNFKHNGHNNFSFSILFFLLTVHDVTLTLKVCNISEQYRQSMGFPDFHCVLFNRLTQSSYTSAEIQGWQTWHIFIFRDYMKSYEKFYCHFLGIWNNAIIETTLSHPKLRERPCLEFEIKVNVGVAAQSLILSKVNSWKTPKFQVQLWRVVHIKQMRQSGAYILYERANLATAVYTVTHNECKHRDFSQIKQQLNKHVVRSTLPCN